MMSTMTMIMIRMIIALIINYNVIIIINTLRGSRHHAADDADDADADFLPLAFPETEMMQRSSMTASSSPTTRR